MPGGQDSLRLAMRLLLMRHGIAEVLDPSGSDDAGRRLTREGRRRVQAIAKGMGTLGMAPDAVVTSPLARCRETAEIVCTTLGVGAPVRDGRLAPGADFHTLADLVAERPDATELALCGHQPDLGRMTEELTGADIEVKKGAVIVIEAARVRPHGGMLVGLYPPRALRRLGA